MKGYTFHYPPQCLIPDAAAVREKPRQKVWTALVRFTLSHLHEYMGYVITVGGRGAKAEEEGSVGRCSSPSSTSTSGDRLSSCYFLGISDKCYLNFCIM